MINILTLTALVVFYALIIGRTLMLVKQGVKVWVISSGKGIAAKVFEALLVPIALFWTLVVALQALSINMTFAPNALSTPIFDVLWLQWLGLALCLLGVIVFFLALISFGNAWRVGIDEENSNRLVTNGIFSVSRNPIFFAMDMFFLGVALVYPNWFFIVSFVTMGVGTHLQILREEKFLAQKFETVYSSYKKRTPRYILSKNIFHP